MSKRKKSKGSGSFLEFLSDLLIDGAQLLMSLLIATFIGKINNKK